MGDKLWPTFKNSQCQLNRLLKVPLGSLLLHNELTDNTRSTLHVLNIVVYTLHSDFYQYTSLETMTHVFETYSFGKNEIKCSYAFFFTTSKHICLEQLSWPRSWIWLAAHVSGSHRTFRNILSRQSASTEAIFSSTWNLHAKSLCSEN